jgi:hypothetical protein
MRALEERAVAETLVANASSDNAHAAIARAVSLT